MRGRFTLKTPVERLSEQFQFPQIIPLKPRYNIAPSQSVAVVRRLPDDLDRKLAMLRWGLIPAWVKDQAEARQPINAKAETVDKLPTFRAAFLLAAAGDGRLCGRTRPGQFASRLSWRL